MSLKNCHNFEDFRKLAKKKLPSPIFHYIDGGADDESTLRRNTDSFNYARVIEIFGDCKNYLIRNEKSKLLSISEIFDSVIST